MVKQKIVMHMNSKQKQEAFEIAARLPGISSVTKEGENIVVVGEGVDAVELLTKIRKKTGFMTWIFKKNMGSAHLVSVEEVKETKEEEKKEEEKKEDKEEEKTICYAQGMNYWPQQPYLYYI